MVDYIGNPPVIPADNTVLYSNTFSALPITNISGTGTAVTVSFATQSSIPFAAGQTVTLLGCSPAFYNGSWLITTGSTNSVTFSSTLTGTYSGGTISEPQTSTSFDTSGYNTVSLQVTGGVGSITLEGSNDNVNWSPVLVLKADSLSLQTQIESPGIFIIKSGTQYLKLDINYLVSNISVVVLGKSSQSPSASDLLNLAMDANTNTPLSVNVLSGNVRPVDSLGPYLGTCTSGTNLLLCPQIDTTGFNSIVFQIFGINNGAFSLGGVNFQGSNDGINFFNVSGYSAAAGAAPISTVTTSNTVAIFPVTTKYFKALATSYTSGSAQAITYLRTSQFSQLQNAPNVAISNTPAVTISGTPVVEISQLGASTLPVLGSAPSTTAMPAGSVDTSSLGRLLRTDTMGRPTISGQQNVANAPNNITNIVHFVASTVTSSTAMTWVSGYMPQQGDIIVGPGLQSGSYITTFTGTTTITLSNTAILGVTSQYFTAISYSTSPLTQYSVPNSVSPIGLIAGTFQNQTAINVQDTSLIDGQGYLEILVLVLQELKVLNQQIYELPRLLNTAFQNPMTLPAAVSAQLGDEPALLRQDSSIFLNQT